jgi:hypothetical protein
LRNGFGSLLGGNEMRGDSSAENKSGFIGGLLPLPISGSCRPWHSAAIGPRSYVPQLNAVCVSEGAVPIRQMEKEASHR